MSFKGEFYWIRSMRQGGRKAISFTLTCTNLFQSETIDAAIVDGTGQLQPMIFRQQTIKAKIANQARILTLCSQVESRCMKWADEVKSGDADNLEARAATYYWKNIFSKFKGMEKCCMLPYKGKNF